MPWFCSCVCISDVISPRSSRTLPSLEVRKPPLCPLTRASTWRWAVLFAVCHRRLNWGDARTRSAACCVNVRSPLARGPARNWPCSGSAWRASACTSTRANSSAVTLAATAASMAWFSLSGATVCTYLPVSDTWPCSQIENTASGANAHANTSSRAPRRRRQCRGGRTIRSMAASARSRWPARSPSTSARREATSAWSASRLPGAGWVGVQRGSSLDTATPFAHPVCPAGRASGRLGEVAAEEGEDAGPGVTGRLLVVAEAAGAGHHLDDSVRHLVHEGVAHVRVLLDVVLDPKLVKGGLELGGAPPERAVFGPEPGDDR